jgi:hypothetical protein
MVTMTNEKDIEKLKKDYPKAASYILDDLGPFDWKSLGFVKGKLVHIKDDSYYVDEDKPLVVFTLIDSKIESNYPYKIFIGNLHQYIRISQALFELEKDVYWRISYYTEEDS